MLSLFLASNQDAKLENLCVQVSNLTSMLTTLIGNNTGADKFAIPTTGPFNRNVRVRTAPTAAGVSESSGSTPVSSPHASGPASPVQSSSPGSSSSKLECEKVTWARLISQSTGKEIKIAGSAGANFNIRDESRANLGLLHACSGKFVLEPATMSQNVTVNGVALKKGERIALSNGDELSFEAPTKKRSDFVFQQLATPPILSTHTCPSPAAPAGSEQPALRLRRVPAPQPVSSSTNPVPNLPGNFPAIRLGPKAPASGTLELRLNDQPIASVDLSNTPMASAAASSSSPHRHSFGDFAAAIESQAQMREHGLPMMIESSIALLRDIMDPATSSQPPSMQDLFRMMRPGVASSSATPVASASMVPQILDQAIEVPAVVPSSNSLAAPIPDPTDATTTTVVDTSRDALLAQFKSHVATSLLPGMLTSPGAILTSFDKFPYHLSDTLKQVLLNTTHLFLQTTEDLASKHVPESVKSISRRLLLLGQHGTDLYQDHLVQALAKHYGASIVSLDESVFTAAEKAWVDIKGSKIPAVKPQAAPSESDFAVTPACCDGPIDAMEVDSPAVAHSAASTSALKPASQPTFKVGDRVRFIGGQQGSELELIYKYYLGSAAKAPASSAPSSTVTVLHPPTSSESGNLPGIAILRRPPSAGSHNERTAPEKVLRSPPYGLTGTVSLVLGPKRLGVKFDQTFTGAIPLPQVCEEKLGGFCTPADLALESELAAEPDVQVLDLLFGEIESKLQAGAKIILHAKRMEKLLVHHFNRFVHFKSLVDGLKGQIVVVAGACSSSVGSAHHSGEKEGHRGGIMISARSGSSGMDVLDQISNQLRGVFSPTSSSGSELPQSSMASKVVNIVFPMRIVIHPPESTPQLVEWEKRLEQDIRKTRSDQNISNLRGVLHKHGFDCLKMNEKTFAQKLLSSDALEKIAGFAISDHVMQCAKAGTFPAPSDSGKVELAPSALDLAVQMLRHNKPHKKKSVLDTATENPFEKQLLTDVIPPTDIGVQFDDIGALDKVKDTLRELVMLPLQRPELFRRGNLAKPCKGILLFGPPGTGKTMLAKAVATESGANFINISMASVGSKWFGEGEKYARAVFTLASKLAPSVIFIDEVDAILGRRDKHGEHEAMRKIKNELMMMWDGLKSMEGERVLVLAATNRPMDLDEAVLRRLPRRLLVDLPDASNRKKILKVLLEKEDLASCVSLDELGEMTEGFTGSDMKNLCVAAAYQPIRDLIAAEKTGDASAALRPVQMSDFRKALTQVRPSVSEDAPSIADLRKWNDEYGEGANKGKTTLPYFM
jgi:AAA+ superfamily predicted ATPase